MKLRSHNHLYHHPFPRTFGITSENDLLRVYYVPDYLNNTKHLLLPVIRKATEGCLTINGYLTADEITKVMKLDLPSHLGVHRDIFVMACFVGSRHSDWHQIRQSNVVIENKREILRFKDTKTGSIVHVPVHPIVRYILNKYGGTPPRVIANQKFNKALKEIAGAANFGMVMIDGQLVEKSTEISTHTARRSLATNAYLSKELEVYQIMNCTGHKTESTFLNYLKLNGKDFAIQAAESKFFTSDFWSGVVGDYKESLTY